jgi:hypothetical protein
LYMSLGQIMTYNPVSELPSELSTLPLSSWSLLWNLPQSTWSLLATQPAYVSVTCTQLQLLWLSVSPPPTSEHKHTHMCSRNVCWKLN